MEVVKCYTSWRRFFTLVWWKLQIVSLITGRPPLNIVATFEVEVPDPADKQGGK